MYAYHGQKTRGSARAQLLSALFDSLEEGDKDVVEAMIQSLVEKYGTEAKDAGGAVAKEGS